MIDLNDVAALLHIEEKLRVHGNKYPNMLNAVRAKLDEYEAQHAEAVKPTEPEAPDASDEVEEETETQRRI